MNPIVFALRHPYTVMVAVLALVLGSGLAVCADEDRHLPQPQPAGHLRGPALRRPRPRPDGRPDHQLLRVPLPLHQRHPPRRVEERPGRRPDEAVLPPRHQHGPGHGRDGAVRQPVAGLHAARHGGAVRHALRHRQRAGRLPGAVEQDQDASAKSRTRPCSRSGRCSPACRASRRRRRSAATSAPSSSTSIPNRLRAYNVSPEDVVDGPEPAATPSAPPGNARIKDQMPIVPVNAMVKDPKELGSIPLRPGGERLPARPGHHRGQHRHPHRLRPGQRQAGRLHPGHQAGRRLHPRRRQRGPQATCRRCKAVLPDGHRRRASSSTSRPTSPGAMWGVGIEGLALRCPHRADGAACSCTTCAA